MSKQDASEPCCPLPIVDADARSATARRFKALGEPTRLQMLTLIAGAEAGEMCVCDLSDGLELSQPTISHHLKVLRDAGLVDCERRGTWVHYWAVPGVLGQMGALLTGLAPAGCDCAAAS